MTQPNRSVKTYDATGRELHVDVPLSQLVVNYRTQGLLGEFIFPVVTVTKQSDMIPIIPLGEFLKEEACFRAPGTEARMVRFNVGTAGYFCKNYALKYPITVEDRENQDRVWNLRENGAYFISDLIRISKERRVCNIVNSGSNVNTAFVPKSAWNLGGNPLECINAALNRVQDVTGFRPNVGVMGLNAWRSTRQNSAIRGYLFPHGGGLPTTKQVADLLELGDLQVAQGYYNTAAENFAATLSPFMSDAFYGFFLPGGAVIGPLPRYGATFRWQLAGVPSMTVEVHAFDQKTKSEEVEVGVYDDERVIDTRLGVSILGVNSSQSGGI
jgi:hypothetical protein